ncbi:MAG TPA: hypothetical protein VNI57_14225, partial [Candidatus Saccharimonadales bacterium]|nr:hypothetical protein [Candidatus Saccharimonadales bacterium]
AGAGARVIIAARRLRPGRAAARISRGILVPFREAARRSHEILLNATPVGSKGEALPVPARALKARLVGDMVYRRGGTPLVRAARERGLAAFGGEEVLLAQAVEQFRLFTGRKAPEEVMRRALLRALRPGRGGAG